MHALPTEKDVPPAQQNGSGYLDAFDSLDREISRLERECSNWKAVARNLGQASPEATAAYYRQVKAHGLTP